jgi:hypothetical protein
MLNGNYMDGDDYCVVMDYDDQSNCISYLCMLRLECKPYYVNQLKMANNLLKST